MEFLKNIRFLSKINCSFLGLIKNVPQNSISSTMHPEKIVSETKESFGEAKDSHSEEMINEIEDFCDSATEQVENLSNEEERLGEKARLMLEKSGYIVTVCHDNDTI